MSRFHWICFSAFFLPWGLPPPRQKEEKNKSTGVISSQHRDGETVASQHPNIEDSAEHSRSPWGAKFNNWLKRRAGRRFGCALSRLSVLGTPTLPGGILWIGTLGCNRLFISAVGLNDPSVEITPTKSSYHPGSTVTQPRRFP